MGGIFGKKKTNTAHSKPKVVKATNKINKTMKCEYCGNLYYEGTLISEYKRHIDHCEKKQQKHAFEEMFQQLKTVNHELNGLQKAVTVMKKHTSHHHKTNSESNTMSGTVVNLTKHKSVSNNSVYKEDSNSGMFLFSKTNTKTNKTKNNIHSNNHHKETHKNKNEINENNYIHFKEFPFEEKIKIFRSILNKLKVDWRDGACTIVLDRDNLLSQSIEQFYKIDPYKELKINFKGEINHDAGGLIREWFTVIFKEIQSEKLSK
jgi:hypothetical protein